MLFRSSCCTLAVVVLATGPTALATPTPNPAPAAASNKLTKDRCIDANAQSQPLRRAGQFSSAREQLKTCADARCPRIVRDDCAGRLDELERVQPTVVFEAKRPDGSDLSVVDVQMDGHPWSSKLDGTALPVDPGEHTFSFAVPQEPAVTRQLVIREGEKGRRETIVIGTPKEPTATPVERVAVAPASSSLEASSPAANDYRTVGLVVGGVGLAGIVVGSVFGLLTKGAVESANKCADGHCLGNELDNANGDHATAVRDGMISTIGFIAGGALLAGGAVLFFLPRSADSTTQQTGRLLVVPSAGRSAAGLMLHGSF